MIKSLILLLLLGSNVSAQTVAVMSTPRIFVDVVTRTTVLFDVQEVMTPTQRDYVVVTPVGLVLTSAFFTANNWRYLNNTIKQPVAALKAGTVSFIFTTPGTFEGRLYRNGSLTDLAKKWTFTVDLTTLTLNWANVTVTHRSGNSPDQINLVLDPDKGTVLAPKDAVVILPPPSPPPPPPPPIASVECIAGACIVEGTTNTWTDGKTIWAGNPYCAMTGLLPQAISPVVDAGGLIEGYHCPAPGSSEGQPRILLAGWLDSPCSEWYGNAPDIGACELYVKG